MIDRLDWKKKLSDTCEHAVASWHTATGDLKVTSYREAAERLDTATYREARHSLNTATYREAKHRLNTVTYREARHSLTPTTYRHAASALILLATFMLTPLLVAGCAEKDKELIGDDSAFVQELKCVDVVKRTLDRIDQLPGEIQAYQDVAVYPKVPGFIKWIGIDRGSVVKKNQAMVGLFAPELNAQQHEAFAKTSSIEGELHEAESKLASAKATLLEANAKMLGDNDTYVRTKEASEVPGVVAPNDVIVLGKVVEADKEKIKAWEQNVLAVQNQIKSLNDAVTSNKKSTESYADIADYLLITAPFDGYITERNMHVGSFVGPLGKGAYPPIVRIQQLNLLRIVTPVPEIDTSGVIPGAKVQFTVSTHPGERFTGTVARLGNYLEQKTRTMPVELNYWNHGNRVLPGMFCEVFWPTKRQHPTLFVPSTAVETTSTLEQFVCLVDHAHKIKWIKVRKGETMGNLVEVFGELNEGDVVALKGTDELKEGTEVKPVMVTRETAELSPVERPHYSTHANAPYALPDSERTSKYEKEGDPKYGDEPADEKKSNESKAKDAEKLPAGKDEARAK